jgi:hypothetical protein
LDARELVEVMAAVVAWSRRRCLAFARGRRRRWWSRWARWPVVTGRRERWWAKCVVVVHGRRGRHHCPRRCSLFTVVRCSPSFVVVVVAVVVPG